MPEILINQFSAGWLPCDDPISGRKTGLLQMDNLELDTNGALALAGGTLVKQTGFSANAHTIFSRLINNSRHDYSLCVDGNIYRDATSIASGGDATNGAFGTAFNFTLIASGNKRLKDSGSGTPVNLGILPATAAPVLAGQVFPSAVIGDLHNNTVTPLGASAWIVSGASGYRQLASTTQVVVQTYVASPSATDCTTLTNINGQTGQATDADLVVLQGYTPNPQGQSIQIDILLVAGNNAGDVVTDYYTYLWADLGTASYTSQGVFTLAIPRNAFTRVGPGVQDWSTVYGFRITYTGIASTCNLFAGLGAPITSATTLRIYGGSHAQNGSYQYMQVNVNNTGSYLAKAVMGPISSVITANMTQIKLTVQDPSSVDAQCNEAWIYRSGGLLDKWYRVLVVTSSFASQYIDPLSDQDALTLNIFYNTNLVSIASSTISDKIYDIVGPLNGRWYYFTTNFMYPSEVNNPDLVDASIAVRISGSSSELVMWARKLTDSTILVGTSVDIYTLSGTFQTLPDQTIDAYYRPLSCKYPPLTCDAEVFGSLVYYLANDGWRTLDAGGNNPSLVSPTLDRLYRGESMPLYSAPNLKVKPRSTRFPIVIAKNKMFCFVTGLGTPRIEVYDFIRQYWRPVIYGIADFTAACSTQDGQVLVFFADNKLREVDIQTSKLIDGTTKQTPLLTTMVYDGGMPRNRKDSATCKVRAINTDSINVSIIPDVSGYAASLGNLSVNSSATDNFFDMGTVGGVAIVKTYQVVVGSSSPTAKLVLNDISILFDPRPEQRTFVRVLNTNFGSAAPKRLRNWPLVIDTLGNNVTVTPIAADSALAGAIVTVNTTNKDTVNLFLKTDVNVVDYGLTLSSTGLFEFYGMGQPEIVQIFPVAKRFDQVGPEELFRFGKILQLEFRVYPNGGTSIPYKIYFQDSTSISGTFTVVNGVDACYYIRQIKGTGGNVVRMEFGPTAFDFHRMGVRVLVARSGRDTDGEWLSL